MILRSIRFSCTLVCFLLPTKYTFLILMTEENCDLAAALWYIVKIR